VFSQDYYATLEPNVNVDARGLIHELNSSNDTLILKSDTKISYVYSINKDHERELNLALNSNTGEIPLTDLSKGKHLVVVGKSPKKIVFVLRVHRKTSVVASGFDE
jgi:hypothetical protein